MSKNTRSRPRRRRIRKRKFIYKKNRRIKVKAHSKRNGRSPNKETSVFYALFPLKF